MTDTRAAMGSIIDLATEFLQENRSGTIREIATRYGLNEWSIRSALYRGRGREFVVVRKIKGLHRGQPEYVWALNRDPVFDAARFEEDYAKFKTNAAVMARVDWKTCDDDEADEVMAAQVELAELAPRMVEHIEGLIGSLPKQDASKHHETSISGDCRP